jgi:heme-degrading monooxygenase HmoA
VTEPARVDGQLRVLLYQRALDEAAILQAYHEVSRRLDGVPGLLGNELLRSSADPTGFVVVSRWAGAEAFARWEQGPGHWSATAPLRPFRAAPPESAYGIYRVDASY